MCTGTSKTGARSAALLSSASTAISAASGAFGSNSSSARVPRGLASGSGGMMSSAIVGLAGGNQGFGVQAFGRERGVQGFGDAIGRLDRIEGGAPVAPVEHEGGVGQGGITLDHDLAGKAAGRSGHIQRGLRLSRPD